MTPENHNIDSNDISIKELFFVLLRNYKLVLYSMIFFLLLTFLYNRVSSSSYTAESKIIIEEKNKTMSSVFELGLGNEQNFLLNEIQIIQSRSIAEKTVLNLFNSK